MWIVVGIGCSTRSIIVDRGILQTEAHDACSSSPVAMLAQGMGISPHLIRLRDEACCCVVSLPPLTLTLPFPRSRQHMPHTRSRECSKGGRQKASGIRVEVDSILARENEEAF